MAAFRFKIVPHSTRAGVEIVEVWHGDVFVGALYPGDDAHYEVRFVSKFLDVCFHERGHPPAIRISLERPPAGKYLV